MTVGIDLFVVICSNRLLEIKNITVMLLCYGEIYEMDTHYIHTFI